MQEREPLPQSPESILREAKQKLRENFLSIPLFNTLLHANLHANEVITIEPYFKPKATEAGEYEEAGIYLMAKASVKGARVGREIAIDHERFLPVIFRVKSDDGFEENDIDPAFTEQSHQHGFTDHQIHTAALTFVESTNAAHSSLPLERLGIHPETFTWEVS